MSLARLRPGRVSCWLPVLLMVGSVSTAMAECPPFRPEETPLVLFAIEGKQPSPAQVRALVNSGVIHGYPVGVLPPSGPAPLRVGVVWLERQKDPAAIEFDADGDGIPEIVDTRDEQFGYTYKGPGVYQATVTVRDREGNRTTYKRPVTVMTPEAFDGEMQSRWQSLKQALERRDFGPALECVSSMMRQRYDRVLHAVVQGEVEQGLPPIRMVGFEIIEARYETVRPPAGRSAPLDVRFQVDLDGVWRLAVMKPKETSE